MEELNEISHFVTRVKHIQDRFEPIKDIGQGTYGVVQKCKDKLTDQIVAVKKIRTQKSKKIGFPQTTLREVKLLTELNHPNIVELKLVVQSEDPDDDLFLIFEYCEYDLYALLYKKVLDTDHIKSIMKQFLVVLQYCAGQKVIHRDLKPANMFITKQNVLKLGDFGLARKIKDDRARYSETVITLWYRPPEILASHGNKNYKTEVDIWSAGCILYEMVTREQLFKASGNNPVLQLVEICSICGPLPQNNMNQESAELFEMMKKDRIPEESKLEEFLESKFSKYPEFISLIPLLLKMLKLNPDERITAEDALNEPFFRDIDDKYYHSNLSEINEQEIHQKEVSDSRPKKSRPLSQDRLDEIRPEKIQHSSDI